MTRTHVAAGSAPTISKVTLSESAYQEIRRQILHGELGPGEFVSERALAQRLGAGIASVRVALKRLAAEGFVTVEARRGTLVASQSIQDVVDLFEIRRMIELPVVRSIAGRLTDEQVVRIRAILDDTAAAAERGDATEVVASDFAFHLSLCEFHGNKHLAGLLNQVLNGLYREIWYMQNRGTGLTDNVLGRHAEIVAALVEGDADRATQVMDVHLELGAQNVLSRRINPRGHRAGVGPLVRREAGPVPWDTGPPPFNADL